MKSTENLYYLNFYKFYSYCFFICLNAGFDFYFIATWNFLCPSLFQQIYSIDENSKDFNFYQTLMNSLLMLGTLIGNIVGESISNRYGRKNTLVIVDIGLIFLIMIFQIPNVNACLVGRFLCGILLGTNAVVSYIFLKELIPKQRRSFSISILPIIELTFYFVAGLTAFALPLNLRYYWRIYLIIPIIIPITQLAFFIFIFPYDTPYYLLMKNDKENALLNLSLYIKREYLEEIIKDNELSIKLNKENENETWTSVLKNSHSIKRMLYSIVLEFLQPMLGISIITMYAYQIFTQAATYQGLLHQQLLFTYMSVFNFMNLACTMVSSSLYNLFGLRMPNFIGFFITFVSLILISISSLYNNFYYQPILLIIYVLGFCLCLGTSLRILVIEITPERGLKYCLFAYTISEFVQVTIFYSIISLIGNTGLFLLFALFTLIALYFFYICIKETKNKSQAEIIMMYGKNTLCEQLISDQQQQTTNVDQFLVF